MELNENNELIKKSYETNRVNETKSLYEWNFVKEHIYPNVTDDILEYLTTQNLCFEIKGLPVKEEQKPREKAPPIDIFKSETFPEKMDNNDKNSHQKLANQNVTGAPGSTIIDNYNSSLLQTKQIKKLDRQEIKTVQTASTKTDQSQKADKKQKEEPKKKKSSLFSFLGF